MIRISLHVCLFILILASNVETLMSKTEKCYSLVCQVVEAFSESEAVQELGCSLLRKFTSGGQKSSTEIMTRSAFILLIWT